MKVIMFKKLSSLQQCVRAMWIIAHRKRQKSF